MTAKKTTKIAKATKSTKAKAKTKAISGEAKKHSAISAATKVPAKRRSL